VILNIEIFKTNIQQHKDAERIAQKIQSFFPDATISFDLEDCDRILRVMTPNNDLNKVPELIKQNGFECEVLL
jgi:predicted RNA binding protein with dsRBD fold (UPF0201 family)|tara:strand:- start:159067 stop:159285 length:219 start_codon:yes stop_codon:yes gene_type:complete